MLKILKQLTKGVWKEDKTVSKTIKKKPRKRKSPAKSREELIEKFLKSIKKEIKENGSKTVSVSRIFNRIGVKKRSNSSVEDLNRSITELGFFVSPETSMHSDWRASIKISGYPEIELGDLFAKERHLEDYIAQHGLYAKLGIETVQRQFSPTGTRDRLDFLGTAGNQKIVLELKHRDGGKSAVEQVFRYAGLLMQNHENIRKILVTGIQNRETALAIAGQSPEERENFEWYLYNYCAKTGELDFERVTDQQIEEQLKSHLS